jgi:hypothetical protein
MERWGICLRARVGCVNREAHDDLPEAAKKVPAYCIRGAALLINITKPVIAVSANPMMNGPRCPTLSEARLPQMVQKQART